MTRRVLIVGGVAGGASAAARLRRLDEECEIVLFDRGPHVSFANCGLPYYVGNVIVDERRLLVASRELFRNRFNIDVRTEHEVTAIDRAAQTIRVKDLREGSEHDERYDGLVLAPGAAPIRPVARGLDLPGVFVVRTIPDTRRIRAWLEAPSRREAVVVGGGFIGLEMAENLVRRGLAVTVIEKLPQVMPPLDPEMAAEVARHLHKEGVRLRLGEGFREIEAAGDRLAVRTDRDATIPTDLVILALGVRPEVTLAQAAGLAIGARGGIVVDERMQTSDPRIYAVGDAIEVRDVVIGQEIILPLAGPANRQGRVAAEAVPRQNSSGGQVVDLSARIRRQSHLMISTLLHLFRLFPFLCGGHRQLALENLAFRHQLAVYKRTLTRPRLHRTDRLFWVGLTRVWTGWREALVIVTPDTVLRWRRRRFREHWTKLSGRPPVGHPPVSAEIKALVTRMAAANSLWGATLV